MVSCFYYLSEFCIRPKSNDRYEQMLKHFLRYESNKIIGILVEMECAFD